MKIQRLISNVTLQNVAFVTGVYNIKMKKSDAKLKCFQASAAENILNKDGAFFSSSDAIISYSQQLIIVHAYGEPNRWVDKS